MSEKYTGTCYIGVVGPESENGVCRDSIHNIGRRNGDEGPYFIRATKGYEARQEHVKQFLSSSHSFILFLDHDQIFPSDTLERLRSHGLPYVSGYYMRRRHNPIAPVWFKYGPNGVWPMEPMTEDPPREKLIKLGASGWGCVLVHRDVITAVRDILARAENMEESVAIIQPRRITIEDQLKRIRYQLTRHTSFLFQDVLSRHPDRVEVSVTLLAMLELIKRRELVANQTEMFGPIELRKAAATTTNAAAAPVETPDIE